MIGSSCAVRIDAGTASAAKIKSHHNVGGLPEDMQFELVEPLRALFKDEVRAVGTELGLPDEIVCTATRVPSSSLQHADR